MTHETLAGTISATMIAEAADPLCIVDLAPGTLGVFSSDRPTTMLRGTITFAYGPTGECMGLEHSVRAADGTSLTYEELHSLIGAVQQFAEDELSAAATDSAGEQDRESELATVLTHPIMVQTSA